MNTVRSADGTTISYTRAGQGPPLILVDGALCSRSFGPMPKLAEQLAPHFTVYTYDRRGRGESGDTQPYEPDREIEDLEALVALAGDTVYLHGTSSGAALALGRVTYEGFAAAFGGQSGGMADQMNNTPKYVVSSTLASADWANSTLISGSGDDIAGQIGELKQQPGQNIGMTGSSTLVSWLLRHGLLDQLDLLVFPVVIGSGKRLFSEPDGQVPLTLTSSQAFSTGVVHLTYEPAS
jgi:dihydrofolate reductase